MGRRPWRKKSTFRMRARREDRARRQIHHSNFAATQVRWIMLVAKREVEDPLGSADQTREKRKSGCGRVSVLTLMCGEKPGGGVKSPRTGKKRFALAKHFWLRARVQSLLSGKPRIQQKMGGKKRLPVDRKKIWSWSTKKLGGGFDSIGGLKHADYDVRGKTQAHGQRAFGFQRKR